MSYKKALAIVTVAAATIALHAGVARAATPIVVGDGWHFFGGDNSQPYPASPFTFTASGPVVVKVTDVSCPGDVYAVSDGATSLGTTSPPGYFACDYPGSTPDPDPAYADPNYSHGSWTLGAGTHSIGVAFSSSPYPAGGGYIRVDAAPVSGGNVPVAVDDEYVVEAGGQLQVNVLQNDFDPDGDAMAAVLVQNTMLGKNFKLRSDGTLTYRPKKDFRGDVFMQYKVVDSTGAESNIATVTVHVDT